MEAHAGWLVECGKCGGCRAGKGCLSPQRAVAAGGLQRFRFEASEQGDAAAVVEDYLGAGGARMVEQAVPDHPLLRQLGQEASFLLVCILRRYVFLSTHAGSVSRGVLQFCLNFVAEWVPAYLEKMYHAEKLLELQKKQQQLMHGKVTAAGQPQPQVKLYLRSFLVSLSFFLEDLALVMKKPGVKSSLAVADGLLDCLARRKTPSVFNSSTVDGEIRAAKVTRVKTLYNARMQLHFGDMAWQGNIWMQSMVRSLSPLIVNLIDTYCTPYNMSMLLNRMLDLMLVNAKAEADPLVLQEIANREKKAKKDASGKKLKDAAAMADPGEERLSKEYGSLINSITTSVLDMVEISGLFRVLTAVAKPLRMLFQKSIGQALSVALEASVEDDLKKVRFLQTLLFGAEMTTLMATTDTLSEAPSSQSMATGEAVEDLLSSVFDNLPDLQHIEAKLNFSESPEEQHQFLNQFYESTCMVKLEELILLQLSRKSTTIAKLSGDYVKQMLRSLTGSIGLVLRSEDLLQILVYDYVLPQML